jgi:prevent-host-death family protein
VDFSIAEAKSQFAQVVHQAESGQAVRITRRGRPVAVVLSEAEYTRLATPREGLLAYTLALRAQAVDAGIAFFDEGELAGVRDRSERARPGCAGGWTASRAGCQCCPMTRRRRCGWAPSAPASLRSATRCRAPKARSRPWRHAGPSTDAEIRRARSMAAAQAAVGSAQVMSSAAGSARPR